MRQSGSNDAAAVLDGPAPVNLPQRQRLHGLDALRGIAALWVCVFHWFLRYPSFVQGAPLADRLLVPGLTWFEAGTVPVLCFFMISGFVIAWTVERCRTPMDFVVSRASRLYPTYWAAVAVSAVLALLLPFPGPPATVAQIVANLTMVQSFVGLPDLDGVFWSLAVELLFYVHVLIVFSCGLWPRMHQIVLGWVALCLVKVILARWAIHVPWRAEELLNLQFGPFLASGTMLYQVWRGHQTRWTWFTLALCGLFLAMTQGLVVMATCVAMGCAMLAAARGRLRWMETAPLLGLGAISYALYVSHQMLSYSVIRAWDGAGLAHVGGIAVAAVLSLGTAGAITRWIERPAMQLVRTAWRARTGRR